MKLRKLQDLKGDGKFCSEQLSLLNIELDHIIPDELYLLLRITDVLLEAAIDMVAQYDQHEHTQSGGRHSVLNKLDGAMLQKLITAINSCGVQFKVWEE